LYGGRNKMNETILQKEDVLLKEGIKMLIEKFGIIDTNRFINGIKDKRTESVKRHQKWQKELNEKEFLD